MRRNTGSYTPAAAEPRAQRRHRQARLAVDEDLRRCVVMAEHWLCQYQTPDDHGAAKAAPYADFDTEEDARAFAKQRSTAYGLPAVVFPIGGAP